MDLWRDAAIDRSNKAVENEEASGHNFAELLESVCGQLYEEIQHLISDILVSKTHEEWLQGAAVIVE